LLGDEHPLNIEGSEAATLNSHTHCRVSDLAVWLIAAARHLPWRAANTPAERDAEIAQLRSRLAATT